jgi:FlaA1/EpsC-like NDP-sugar epimerase
MLDRFPRLDFVPRARHLFVFDVAAVGMAILAAFGLRFDANDVVARLAPYFPAALLPLVIMPPVFVGFGLYRREWRYASITEMFALVGAVLVGTGISFVTELILAATIEAPGTIGFPRSVFVIEGLLILALVGGSRFTLRAGLERRGQSGGTDQELGLVRTLVYGAGEVGATVARVAARDADAHLSIVGFLDDDRVKHGSRFLGKVVFGDLEMLDVAVRRTRAEQLLIAMPRASGHAVRRIFEAAREQGLAVRVVPAPRGLVTGDVQVWASRKISLEDLLRREPITIDLDAVTSYLNGASVLVTGGGGSIGSELVRQILTLGPRLLMVLDHHEEALWQVERELEASWVPQAGIQLRTVLADVRSLAAMDSVMREVKPDVVFHAAALKHVPLVEMHPSEGVMTNIVGTYNTLVACQRANVQRFVLISTDKAVDPVGVMGTTKRMAEHLTVAAAKRTGQPYVAVRFGNVLGSSGSVIPTFQQQLARGGPLTITHPDVTRYFMTISEAVSLILEAASSPRSGEIYVLDMGEPVRIVDLANDLILLSGLDPEQIPIVFTGLRSGERLHENLFHDHEITEPTIREGILRVRGSGRNLSPKEVEALAQELATAAQARDDTSVRELLKQVHLIGMPTSLDRGEQLPLTQSALDAPAAPTRPTSSS